MKKGWEYKKLGEVGTFVRGGNFSKKDFVENGFPCIHYGQIHMKFGIETFKHISSVPSEMVKPDRCARKGDLVIAITSEDDAGSCKCTAWMGDYDAYVGGHTAIYRHTMQPKYVSYYFMSPFFQKDKLEYTHGFKVVEISPKDIAKISIPVPPLSEQQSIVDYLDSAFAKIDAMKANAEKALNEAKALFQASLKEMLEPKEGWEEKCLKDIAEYSIGLTYKPTDVCDDGTIVLRSSNIQEGKLDLNDIVRVNTSIKEKLYVQCGDILMCSRNGSARLVGKVCIIPELKERMTYGTFMMVIRSAYNPLLYHYFDTNLFRRQIKHGEANMINQITRYMLDEVKLNLPPIKEQQSIVATLDSLKSKVDRLQENYEKISQECDALKQAILRQVFE